MYHIMLVLVIKKKKQQQEVIRFLHLWAVVVLSLRVQDIIHVRMGSMMVNTFNYELNGCTNQDTYMIRIWDSEQVSPTTVSTSVLQNPLFLVTKWKIWAKMSSLEKNSENLGYSFVHWFCIWKREVNIWDIFLKTEVSWRRTQKETYHCKVSDGM